MSESRKGLMTEGSIVRQLILFSIPLLIGNLFQQLYNTVDSIIVGNYVGPQALAAVGTSTPLVNLLIGFFMGIAAGAGVIISRYFGARKSEELALAVHTFSAFTLIFGVIMTVIGIFCSSFFLELIKTPKEIFADADTYLKIYFAGILFTMIYNSGSGILRAVGDSRRPLVFLVVSSVINVILDLVFVIYFDMGTAGVAWATLIATAVSSILVIIVLLRSKEDYRLIPSKIRLNKLMLGQIVRLGIPSGLQQMIVSFSNTMVQSYVNQFNYAAIAGFSSANKFDNFLSLPAQSFSLSITTFVGQNLGAKKLERVKKGIRICTIMAIGVVTVVGIPAYLYAEQCIRIFADDPEVIKVGSTMMRTVIPFYFALCINQVLTGAIRGAGVTTVPMIAAIFSFCIVRQVFLALTMPLFQTVDLVFWSYALTWALCSVILFIYYKKGHWMKKFQ